MFVGVVVVEEKNELMRSAVVGERDGDGEGSNLLSFAVRVVEVRTRDL